MSKSYLMEICEMLAQEENIKVRDLIKILDVPSSVRELEYSSQRNAESLARAIAAEHMAIGVDTYQEMIEVFGGLDEILLAIRETSAISAALDEFKDDWMQWAAQNISPAEAKHILESVEGK